MVPDSQLLQALMRISAERHRHLCPRQVLGVRIGLRGLRELDLCNCDDSSRYENSKKRLLTIVETDGCGLDGIAVATDCAVGRRTLRVMDFGKVAATMVDTRSKRAVRVSPTSASRDLAHTYAPEAPSRWHAYLAAYQVIPDEALLNVAEVALTQTIEEIISRPGARAICIICGEEVINEREIIVNGHTLCRTCAGDTYYHVL